MKEFNKEIKEAISYIESKGYFVNNMTHCEGGEYEYEISDCNGKVIIDWLSIAQLIAIQTFIK